MKAYGDKIGPGYISRPTQKSWCRCCNGSYAKIGRSASRDNNIRGLKKAARRGGRSLVQEGLDDYKDYTEMKYEPYESADELIISYNLDLLWDFVNSLRLIAPELSWADSDGSWHDMFEARALSALPHKMKRYAPSDDEEYMELLEKICREQFR
jgi:hypothetical protein